MPGTAFGALFSHRSGVCVMAKICSAPREWATREYVAFHYYERGQVHLLPPSVAEVCKGMRIAVGMHIAKGMRRQGTYFPRIFVWTACGPILDLRSSGKVSGCRLFLERSLGTFRFVTNAGTPHLATFFARSVCRRTPDALSDCGVRARFETVDTTPPGATKAWQPTKGHRLPKARASYL
jgi:hypothetical protein